MVVAGPERLAAAAEGDGGRSVVATRHETRGNGSREEKFWCRNSGRVSHNFISGPRATGLEGWTAGIRQVGVMDGHGGHREEAGRRVVLDLGLLYRLGSP